MGRTKSFNRSDVLESAIQLFWKKGYSDTSLSDIEKATGVNKSGLYSEFKDKDDIFLESLKLYRDKSPLYGILVREPLGWKNVDDFLKSNMTCKGLKGCFMTNTYREFSIIPQKVRTFIEQNSAEMRELVLKNVQASGTKKDHQILTNLILTFGTGISLKLNVIKPEQIINEVDSFLELVKN